MDRIEGHKGNVGSQAGAGVSGRQKVNMATASAAAAPTGAAPAAVFDYERWLADLDATASRYRGGTPFPHLAFDNFLPTEVALRAAREFPSEASNHWIRYRHVNENKASTHHWEDFPPTIRAIIEEMNSTRFLALLSRITGIENLRADPDIEGGGMHQSWTGGFLNVHTDFTMHRDRPGWRRRCNLILYMNEGWNPTWGGDLQLWDSRMKENVRRLDCLLNRAVLFNTPRALHGFPDLLTCPPEQSRKSLQWYFYTVDEPSQREAAAVATVYFARPGDSSIKKVMIRLDNLALRAYSRLKRTLGLTDAFVSRMMSIFSFGKH